MTDTKKLVGIRIKALRKRAGLTQEKLAEQLGMDARHLSRLEVGHHFPALDTLEKISICLKVPLAEFFQFPEQINLESKRDYFRQFAEQATEEQLNLAMRVINLILG